MSLGFPLVAWGTVEDISASPWANVGSPTVTPGQADPFGGTGAVLISDTDTGSNQGRSRTFNVQSSGTQWFNVWIRQGTAAVSNLIWFDNSTSGIMVGCRFTWTAGVPAAAISSGSGSLVGPVSCGGGWYMYLLSVNNIDATHAQRINLYGAVTDSVSTGSTYWFWQSAVLLDLLDQALCDRELMDGSDQVQSPSGFEDAWTVNRYHRMQALAQWIPSVPQSAPAIVSGWSGTADIPCVNQGVSAMLAAGRDKTLLRYVPDRSVCTTYIDSYLADPIKDGVALHVSGQRNVKLTLRNMTTAYPSY